MRSAQEIKDEVINLCSPFLMKDEEISVCIITTSQDKKFQSPLRQADYEIEIRMFFAGKYLRMNTTKGEEFFFNEVLKFVNP